MRRVIFYSWQSDLPNSTNRGFIQSALAGAANAIAADNSIEVEPVVDRDTKDVAGAPDISSTIFAKIIASDVFVADVSIVTRVRGSRYTPNPNVLIELGYALKALGPERIVLVFNRAFGRIEELPFDLRTRRVTAYEMAEHVRERAPVRNELVNSFDEALRAALRHETPTLDETPSILAAEAIELNKPNRIVVLRRNLDSVFKKLNGLEPKKHRDGGTVEELVAGIGTTQEPIAEFSKITEIIAAMNDFDAALEIYRWFGKIYELYNLPKNYNGKYSTADHDYFKFVGHEMFVTLVAFLLREQRWDLLARLLEEPTPVRYIRNQNGPVNVTWRYASEHQSLLANESGKRRRTSLHADILKERHTIGGLAAVLPFDEFVAADYFLSLRKQSDSVFPPIWIPRSILYLEHAPMFFRNAEQRETAERLMKILKISSIKELKERLISVPPVGIHEFWSIRPEDVDRIGTR